MLFLHTPWPPNVPVKAVMTTRLGGLEGAPPFEGFNLGINSGDDETRVKNHWDMLTHELGLLRPPKLLRQVHGATLVPPPETDNYPPADGWIVSQAKIPVAVQVADCLAVALARKDGSLAALVHAGWRGLASGILDHALEHLRMTYHENIYVWIGPGIDDWAYEVGEEVYQGITRHYPWSFRYFKPTQPGHFRVGLGQIALEFFQRQGCLTWLSKGGTWSRADLWYSWRRSQPTGRQAMILWIEG